MSETLDHWGPELRATQGPNQGPAARHRVPKPSKRPGRNHGRGTRRARLEARVTQPVTEARDPLLRELHGAPRRWGRGTLVLISATLIHVVVLVGFVLGNQIYSALTALAPAEPEPMPVAVVDSPEPSEAPKPVEPEPEPEPLPTDQLEATTPPDAVPAPPVGISADSTVEGGDGPAYQVGSSLAGATSAGTLTQELLANDKKASAAEDLVMTQDAVDALPSPAASNRRPEVPPRARRDGVSGFVKVQLLIGKSGSVEELKILESEPAGVFDQGVLDTLPTWRFAPATYKGQPVMMRIKQTIRFDVS